MPAPASPLGSNGTKAVVLAVWINAEMAEARAACRPARRKQHSGWVADHSRPLSGRPCRLMGSAGHAPFQPLMRVARTNVA